MKILYLIPFVLIIIGCKPKSNNGLDYYDYSEFEFSVEEVLSKNIFNDTINSELLEAALPEKGFLTVDYARNLKERILQNALYLTDNTNFNHYGQNGLAYVWGGKNHQSKMKPVRYRGERNKCQEELYGLDCSGFIYQIFLMSGFKFFSGSEQNPSNFANSRFFSNPNEWSSPIRKYCDYYDCLKVERINEPPLEIIESGDILFFYNSKNITTHIGICLEIGNKLIFFDSGGNPGSNCQSVISKGPRRSIVSKNLLNVWNKRRHGIIKIFNPNL